MWLSVIQGSEVQNVRFIVLSMQWWQILNNYSMLHLNRIQQHLQYYLITHKSFYILWNELHLVKMTSIEPWPVCFKKTAIIQIPILTITIAYKPLVNLTYSPHWFAKQKSVNICSSATSNKICATYAVSLDCTFHY